MRPLVIDTSVWIDWLRGIRKELREEARGRILFISAVSVMELMSGSRDRRSFQIVSDTIDKFKRHGRVLAPSYEEFIKAGTVLADLGWPASKKASDVLIAVCARRIGAEIWTCDYSDFHSIAEILQLEVRKV